MNNHPGWAMIAVANNSILVVRIDLTIIYFIQSTPEIVLFGYGLMSCCIPELYLQITLMHGSGDTGP